MRGRVSRYGGGGTKRDHCRMLTSIADWWLGRDRRANPYFWHRWWHLLPVRSTDGSWHLAGNGQLWRRLTPEGWEYLVEADNIDMSDMQW